MVAKLSRIGDLPETQRSFALFDTRDDYELLGLSARDIDQLDSQLDSRDANIGEYERFNGSENDLLIQIGNPANRRLRREWVKANDRDWPTDPITKRNYDVAHIKALADGGTNTLENIRPMHPLEHRLQHMMDGDLSRWAKRAGIARAFGGTVARGLGSLSLPADILGMASGRIRTDSFDNFVADMVGPSGAETMQRFQLRPKTGVNPKPSDLVV